MDEETLAKNASLIPEVYYDFIARVPPGAFVLLALIAIYYPGSYALILGEKFETGSALLLTLAFSVASYTAGLLLSPLGNWIVSLFWNRIFEETCQKYNDLIPEIEKNLGISCSPGQTQSDTSAVSPAKISKHMSVPDLHDRIYRQLHEFLKEVDVQARVLLTKMQAEAALCSNLTAGLLLVLIALVTRRPPWFFQALGWVAVGLVLSVAGAWFRSKRLLERQFSYLAQLSRPGKKAVAAWGS